MEVVTHYKDVNVNIQTNKKRNHCQELKSFGIVFAILFNDDESQLMSR